MIYKLAVFLHRQLTHYLHRDDDYFNIGDRVRFKDGRPFGTYVVEDVNRSHFSMSAAIVHEDHRDKPASVYSMSSLEKVK
jgi:hypothetical protein